MNRSLETGSSNPAKLRTEEHVFALELIDVASLAGRRDHREVGDCLQSDREHHPRVGVREHASTVLPGLKPRLFLGDGLSQSAGYMTPVSGLPSVVGSGVLR